MSQTKAMIHKYYYPTIAELHQQLHTALQKPYENNLLWLELQENLLQLTVRVESKILRNKAAKKQLKADLGDSTIRLTKEIATLNKRKVAAIENKIDEYHQLLAIFKSFGDAMAFTFIDRFELKSMTFKPSSGFMINKKGNRLERKCLRAAYKKEGIGILNDLTNVLKYSDLTLVSESKPFMLIELKSGKNRTQREERQRIAAKKLTDFLTYDTPSDILKEGMISHRMGFEGDIQGHVHKLKDLISKAKTQHIVSDEVENGLVYVVTYGDVDSELIGSVFGQTKFVDPLLFIFNQFKYENFGFYPACLSFSETDHYIDYLVGNMQVFVLWDINLWKLKLAKHSLTLEDKSETEHMMFRITGNLNGEEVCVGVGDYLINRMLFEFLSPEWLINNLIYMASKMPNFLKFNLLQDLPIKMRK